MQETPLSVTVSGSDQLEAMNVSDLTNMSITEISNLLGLSESSAFTRDFKKWTGDSPMEYRSNCS